MKILKSLRQLAALIVLMSGFIMWLSIWPVFAAEKTGPTAEKPLVLKVNLFTPAQIPATLANIWILQEVEKRSNGRLKFEIYYSGGLIPAKQEIEGLQAGIADIASVVPDFQPGKVPLLTVTSLPMIGNYFYSAGMAIAELTTEMPEVKAELGRYNLMYLSHAQVSSYGIWANFALRTLADLKGRKIRCVGNHTRIMRDLGAVPVSLIGPETYQALERKTIDGVVHSVAAGVGYKYYEVCHYYYRLLLGTTGTSLLINRNSWNKIPADIQAMFTDLRDASLRAGVEIYETEPEKVMKELEAKGRLKIIKASAEDTSYARDISKKATWNEWVEKMNKSGLAGKKVLDKWLELNRKWEARDPFIQK